MFRGAGAAAVGREGERPQVCGAEGIAGENLTKNGHFWALPKGNFGKFEEDGRNRP